MTGDEAVHLRPVADYYANAIQWREEDHEDLVQEGYYWLIKTEEGYHNTGKELRNISELAHTVFPAAMKWYYKPIDRFVLQVEVEPEKLAVRGELHYIQRIWVGEFIDEVERLYGDQARTVVENLLEPGDDVWRLAEEEMQDKRRRKANGEKVVGYLRPRITRNQVRKVCQMTEGQWETLQLKLRSLLKQIQ